MWAVSAVLTHTRAHTPSQTSRHIHMTRYQIEILDEWTNLDFWTRTKSIHFMSKDNDEVLNHILSARRYKNPSMSQFSGFHNIFNALSCSFYSLHAIFIFASDSIPFVSFYRKSLYCHCSAVNSLNCNDSNRNERMKIDLKAKEN